MAKDTTKTREKAKASSRPMISRPLQAKEWKPAKGLVKNADEIIRDGKSSDIVIPVIGKTGVGRSTFINTLVGRPVMPVSSSLISCTSSMSYVCVDPEIIASRHPKLAGRRVLIVDTPGFEDTHLSNGEVLRRIGVWMASSYYAGMKLGGVIYLHNICERLVRSKVRQMAGVLEGLVGEEDGMMSRVVLATTGWEDVVDLDTGKGLRMALERERELKDVWCAREEDEDEGGRKGGATVKRFWLTSGSAGEMLNIILLSVMNSDDCNGVMKIQREMVDHGKKIIETNAGRVPRSVVDGYDHEYEQTFHRQYPDPAHRCSLDCQSNARLSHSLSSSLSPFRPHDNSEHPAKSQAALPPCHFSFVTPFPVPFPYDIEPDDRQNIEAWLSQREPLHPRAPRLYDSKNRDQPAILLGLCQTALRDCLPHLDVGDAFALLGVPNNNNNNNNNNEQQAVSARKELIDVLSGKSVLMNEDFAPWSVRYSGHQFGSWAGQLGDGRATSILVTPHPSDPSLTYELQLKGAGRTPFSRTADGLAVVRSSVREYLCSEAMQALRIPTTRSLSLIALPSLPVQRESLEKASILTRIAPSFLRIGNFEAFNGPKNMFFFGGGQQEPNWEALRILGEWVKGPVLNLHGDAWGRELVMDVARRNAKMVARWQAYGFMHGVINTDNVSLLGLTIDYGPYAFMDVFDSFHICNHTDEGGRYAYKYQPNMIVFALRRLLDALAPLIGAEIENGGKAVQKGWADDASDEKLNEWKELALQKVKDDLEREIQQVMTDEYGAVMRARLGLTRADPSDESKISKPLLDIMEDHKLDFHSTFRTLSYFKPSLTDEESSLKIFVDKILSATPDAQSSVQRERAQEEVSKWLNRYADRIRSEAAPPESGQERDDKRKNAMLAVNPRFVLRQWVLEEVIKKVEADVAITDHGQEASNNGRSVLAKVLHMACNPYDPWGAEVDPLDQTPAELDAEEQEEKRYCGLGDKKFLGFQCSCSS